MNSFLYGETFHTCKQPHKTWHYVIFPIGSSRICYETWRSASPSEHTQTWRTEQFKAPSAVSGKDKTRHLAQMHKFNWQGHVSPAFLVDSLLWSFSLLGLLKTPWSMCMYVWRGLGVWGDKSGNDSIPRKQEDQKPRHWRSVCRDAGQGHPSPPVSTQAAQGVP